LLLFNYRLKIEILDSAGEEAVTRKTLSLWVGVVIVYLILLILIGVALSACCGGPEKDAFKTFHNLLPVLLAVPGAWLAACFQKRASYLASLRALYERSVSAFEGAHQYTYLDAASQEDFSRIKKELSSVIELFRANFRNLEAEGAKSGLFPFESLKTINDWIDYLGWGVSFRKSERKLVRDGIVKLWTRRLRPSLLAELDRQTPTTFDSPFWGRRSSEDEWPAPPEKSKVRRSPSAHRNPRAVFLALKRARNG
jgi:hypothetical protein